MKSCFLCLLFPLLAFAIAGEDTGSVFQQLPFPGSYQVGMNLVFPRQLTYRLAAFDRFQRNPKLVGRRVSPPILDRRSALPQAR